MDEQDYIDLFDTEYSPPPNIRDNHMDKARENSVALRKEKADFVKRFIQGLIQVGFTRKEIMQQECIYTYQRKGKQIVERIPITKMRYEQAIKSSRNQGK